MRFQSYAYKIDEMKAMPGGSFRGEQIGRFQIAMANAGFVQPAQQTTEIAYRISLFVDRNEPRQIIVQIGRAFHFLTEQVAFVWAAESTAMQHEPGPGRRQPAVE